MQARCSVAIPLEFLKVELFLYTIFVGLLTNTLQSVLQGNIIF